MEMRHKKIIAKEILLLIVSMVIGLLSYVSIYFYNYYLKINIDEYTQQINKKSLLSDSLSRPYTIKSERQYEFTNKFKNKFNDIFLENESYINARLWEDLNKNRFDPKFWQILKVNDLGFGNIQEFAAFVENNLITSSEITLRNESRKLKKDIRFLESKIRILNAKIINSDKQKFIPKYILIFILIICFLIRYLYFLIIWSIKTLKR
ncbi:hypothetical protein MCERE19_02598 [Spirosomataceae bacterium]